MQLTSDHAVWHALKHQQAQFSQIFPILCEMAKGKDVSDFVRGLIAGREMAEDPIKRCVNRNGDLIDLICIYIYGKELSQ